MGHKKWLLKCVDEAWKSPCMRLKYGCYIVKHNKVIAKGHNYPVLDKCKDCCIRNNLNIEHGMSIEACWAVHAEQMALLRAGVKARGADLYIVGVNPTTGDILYRPPNELRFSCTVCARLILDARIRTLYGMTKDGHVANTPEEAMEFAMSMVVKHWGIKDDK